MRRKLVAGNWKMHGSREMTESLVSGLSAELTGGAGCEVAVCPPFPFLAHAAAALVGSEIRLGAQNLCEQDEGAFTGEVSGTMLKNLCCHYVIVGHSERRAIYGETDDLVAAKFQAAQRHGLVPILCVGETLEEREAGVTEDRVGAQVQAVLAAAGIEAFSSAVIAYEPVWAIGTGRNATPEDAAAVHRTIRGALEVMGVHATPILYGGSVNAGNIQALLARPEVNGVLVGGASLDPKVWGEVVHLADQALR